MATSPAELTPGTLGFETRDGVPLVAHVLGEGPTVVLVHGFLSSAAVNWIRPGTAGAIAAAGFRLVMPDLRGHGANADVPAGDLPPDVLALDAAALIEQLEGPPAAVGGYSIGARTAVRLLAGGLRPPRAIVAGMGLRGVTEAGASIAWFLDMIAHRETIRPGDERYLAVRFMRATRANPEVAAAILRAHVDTPETEVAAIPTRTLVVCGAKDHYREDAEALAGALPDGRFVEVPGDHMSAVGAPALATAITSFLTGH